MVAKKQPRKPPGVPKKVAEEKNSSKPTTSIFSSVVSIVIVGIAIAGGGFHWSNSSPSPSPSSPKNDGVPVDGAGSNNSIATRAINNKKKTTSPPPLPKISIAAFHTIDESLGDLRRLEDDNDDATSDEEEEEEAQDRKKKKKKREEAIEKQREDLMTYLFYDDGYVSCLTNESGGPQDMFGVLALKKTKYDFLLRVANIPKFWTVEFTSPEHVIIQQLVNQDTEELLDTAKHLVATCRLLTLTHEDYEGRANRVLQEALKKEDFIETFSVRSQGPASDYRTFVCLNRLTDKAAAEAAADEALANNPFGYTPKNKITATEQLGRDILAVLRYEWGKNNEFLKELARTDPTRPGPMPEGWLAQRDEESGYLYYFNQYEATTSMWERPVPVFGGKGVMVDDPPPTESGKIAHGSIVARKDPCKREDTRKILLGVRVEEDDDD